MNSGPVDRVELLGTAAEFDLDSVIVMDALGGGVITRHLCAVVGVDPLDVVSVTRSANRGDRETDVQIDTRHAVLLVENKIHAAFTEGQQQSYSMEVERIRAEQGAAWAFLIYPEYRRAEMETTCLGVFDHLVSIEKLIAVASASSDSLSRISALVLRRTLQPRPRRDLDPLMSAWGDGYRAVVAELTANAPLSIGRDSLRTKTASSVQFTGGGIGERGWLSHLVELGQVEAGLNGRPPEFSSVPPGAIPRTKRSARKPVPRMSFAIPATEQRGEIASALEVIVELRAWLLSHPTRETS